MYERICPTMLYVLGSKEPKAHISHHPPISTAQMNDHQGVVEGVVVVEPSSPRCLRGVETDSSQRQLTY